MKKKIREMVCKINGHSRGDSKWTRSGLHILWTIQCKRCGYEASYTSLKSRLVGVEIMLGFNGN